MSSTSSTAPTATMASAEVIDPQYLCMYNLQMFIQTSLMELGILPERLQLTPAAKDFTLPAAMADPQRHRSILDHLNDLVNLTNRNPAKIHIGTITDVVASMYSWNIYCKTHSIAADSVYWRMHNVLKALQGIGLDVQDGVDALTDAYIVTQDEKLDGLLSLTVIVSDAAKACEYVNLGVHIGTDVPEHPQTLAEAADAFAKISTLVSGNTTDLEHIERSCGVAHTLHDCWLLERIRFKIKTKERYRQILLDMAREEWMDEQASPSHSRSRLDANVCIACESAREEASSQRVTQALKEAGRRRTKTGNV